MRSFPLSLIPSPSPSLKHMTPHVPDTTPTPAQAPGAFDIGGVQKPFSQASKRQAH